MITRRRFSTLTGAAAIAAALPSRAAPPASSGKKGCCFVTKEGNGWRTRVEQLDASWMYSWGLNHPEGLDPQLEFVPMLWGAWADEALQARCEGLRERFSKGNVKHVLGFNEPDQEEQSNLSVDRVLDLWPHLMEIGAPLISPGCVHPDRDWMNEFMEGVEERRLRVDSVAVHSYGGTNAESLVKRLEGVHQAFGRPLWITEFAVGDWHAKSPAENRHAPARVQSFMREILPALDELSFVERYAWFAPTQNNAALCTSALFDSQNRLTPLGEIYAEHQPA